MKLLDVLNSPWAIVPEKLREIQSIYMTHLRGEKIDIKAIEAKIGQPLNNERKNYDVISGVAVLPVEGVIAKKMNLFTRISGGVSSQILANDFREIMDPNRKDIKAVILNIDSPGGAVNGTQELSRLIASYRGKKPIVSYSDGMMASAAYWIGSAADQIYISGDNVEVGSIGVVTQHIDVSGWESKNGIKTTEITAGKYKRIASEYAPLSESGREYIQDILDQIYSAFVQDVADFRSVTVEQVLGNMADGRIFLGNKTIQAGLVDGVSTLDELITRLAAGDAVKTTVATTVGVTRLETREEEKRMSEKIEITKDYIMANHPDIAEFFRAEGHNKGVEEGKITGAEAERKRIQDVEAQLMPGHETLINILKFDGKTTGPEAAVAVLNAERGVKKAYLENIISDSPDPVKRPAEVVEGPKVDQSAPIEERAKTKWDQDINTRNEFGGDFGAYLAFRKAEDRGQVKILKR